MIKLELDKDLDPARKLGPMGNKKLGAIFANCNRNKYGMTIKCSGKMKRKGVLKYIIGKKVIHLAIRQKQFRRKMLHQLTNLMMGH